ncbi:MAG: penicillin-binding protein [Deltaproteobacteria bacterium HGW-Deltaproteobacteria-1]|nr:MAG: penicillin-binding protein [Deltaproteobacteria bacterium HGW-Deltaproteobacteria-1]
MIRRHPLLFAVLFLAFVLTAAICLRIGYLCVEVDKGLAESSGDSPTIFYGRAMEISKGDDLENIRFADRLKRLSYREVKGQPSAAGTFSRKKTIIRIFLRVTGIQNNGQVQGPVDIVVRGSRVISITSNTGKKLLSIQLEPEEISRIISPKLDSRHQVTLSAISPHLLNAVIASEDSHFYSHFGIDIFAIGRAFIADVKAQRYVEGGSTITQQLAKNFFLSPRKTISRKLHEAELALALELRYSKKQLLEMYLNKIYLGQADGESIYGVEDASGFYFSKRARDLSLEEAALLAGIIHAPNRYYLFTNSKTAKTRRNNILARMQKLAMISDEEFLRASNAPLKLRSGGTPVHMSSHFIDYIRRITNEEMGMEGFYQRGYRYYTTLDPIMQAAAEDAITRGLETIKRKARPAGEPLQAALVAVDPKTGALTAMVGGRSYDRFNRAVDAKRQPGSAFKPFVLLAALSQPLKGTGDKTLSTLVSGGPISLDTPEGTWTPSNYENKEYGMITIRKIIEDSVNTATVRLANDVGFQEVLDTARMAGISSRLLPVPSMALGSLEVTPVELAYAYTTIASGGIRFDPLPFYTVIAPDGGTIIERSVKRIQVFDPRVAYLAGRALEGVVARGTASEAKSLKINFPVSGKTGTTNKNRDSWFVCFTPDIVLAVWVGYDSGADTGLTGATGALRISAMFLRAIYAHSGPPAFITPEGIETALIDPESGFLATEACPQTFRESYLTGTAPRKTCPNHSVNPVMDAVREKVLDVGGFFRKLFNKTQ